MITEEGIIMEIYLQNVSKSLSKQRILSDINLKIEENEIFGLIGPSGSGKTTLIRLMTGAISSDTGSVYLGEKKMPDLKVLESIGYMPQNDALYTDISGRDNLRFFGEMMGMKKAILESRIDEVLQLISLEKEDKKRVQNYSGGMKKRLSLAAALLHKPKILFLDEPTVGIDPILRKRIWDQLETLKEQGTTIIVTTHVMDETKRCDRLALIHQGKILECDTVSNLLSKTKDGSIEELFLKNRGGVRG